MNCKSFSRSSKFWGMPATARDAAEKKAAESLEIGRIVPIYEAIGRLTPRWFRRAIRTALDNLTPDLPDPIPAAVRGHLGLISPRAALWNVHWPEPGESFEDLQSSRTPAHIRMIFDELFFVELGLELKRRQQKAQTGIAFRLDDRVRAAIKKILPFHPTPAQKRVLKEIAVDMEKPYPMRRLLQGDVGSGKTIVGFEAAIIAIENGCQVALMAPTEILAQQHYFSARRILENAGYRIVLLTGSLESDRKREVRRHIAQGNAQLVIGTHALLEEKVEFANLGLVIVDEQHRFGVLQRLKLMKKSGEARGRRAELRSAEATGPRTNVSARRARRSRHDGDANSAHARAHALRRSRSQRTRRAPARSHSDRHPLRGRRPIPASVGLRAKASGGRAPGLRGLSGHRGE